MKKQEEVIVKAVRAVDGIRVEFDGTMNEALNVVSAIVCQIAVMGYDDKCDADNVTDAITAAVENGIKEGCKRIMGKDKGLKKALRAFMETLDED